VLESTPTATRSPAAITPRLRLPELDTVGLGTAALYVVLCIFGLLHFTDPDYWWHLRTGKLILDTGSIPTTDPFSFTAAGRAWVTHEWLSEVLIAGVQSLFGYAGNTVLFTAAAIGAIAVSHRTALQLGMPRILALAGAVLVAAMSVPYWTVRPQALSWLLIAVFINVIVTYRGGGKDRLWLLPPLMLVWANLHGGFVFGLGLLGLFVIAESLERVTKQHDRGLRKPVLVLAAAFLLVAVNPSTYELWLYPLSYLKPGNASSELITEWQSPDFHEMVTWPLALGILTMVGMGVFSRRNGLFIPLLALSFTAMALMASRNQPLFGLVFLVAIAPQAAALPLKLSLRRPTPAQSRLNWSVLALVVIAAAVIAMNPAAQTGAGAKVTGRENFPAAGAAFIRENYPNARVFNDYAWGGYLIDSQYPQKVFIDGRPDMYGDAFVAEYMQVINLQPGWQAVLDKYGVDMAILKPNTPLARELATSWRTVFSGDVEVVFERP
jgi:hypothetical protein